MNWTIKFSDAAKKQLKKLDKQVAKEILNYINEKIASQSDPRQIGKILTGNLGGLWRYRIKNYRLICDIQDNEITILILKIGHRKEIYNKY